MHSTKYDIMKELEEIYRDELKPDPNAQSTEEARTLLVKSENARRFLDTLIQRDRSSVFEVYQQLFGAPRSPDKPASAPSLNQMHRIAKELDNAGLIEIVEFSDKRSAGPAERVFRATSLGSTALFEAKRILTRQLLNC